MGYHRIFLSDRLENLIKAGGLDAENLILDLLEKKFSDTAQPGHQATDGKVEAPESADIAAKRAEHEDRKIRSEVRESELQERWSRQGNAWDEMVFEYEKSGPKTDEGKNIIEAIKKTEEHIRRLEQTGKIMGDVVEETEMIVKRTEHATKRGEGTVKETEEAAGETEKEIESAEQEKGRPQ